MRTWSWLGPVPLVLCSAVALSACHRDRTDLHVVSRGPEGQLSDAVVQELRVVFDKPMVSPALIGKERDGGPLSLDPPAAGRQLWTDDKTLLFRAAAPLPRATPFRAALAGDLRALDGSRTAEPVRWAFTTQRLEVLDLLPGERRFLSPTEKLTLRFSQPVSPSQVAARCVLTGAGAPVNLRLPDEEEQTPRQSVDLVPAQPLGRGADYQLQCDAALSSIEGPAGMAAPYQTALHTYGDLVVSAARPTGDKVDSDDLDIEIEFSNPVQREEVRAHLVSKPRIPALDDGWLEGQDRRKYHARVSLEPGTSYEIKVTAGLKDAFGQTLSKEHLFFFTAGDAKPRLSMEEGTYVVEAQRGRYPLWTRNVTHLEVAAARVPEDKIVPLLERQRESESSDEEGEGAAPDKDKDERSPAQWRRLGLKVAQKRVVTSGVKNKWQDGALDLAALAGGERTGVFVARVEAEEAKEQGSKRVTANVTNLGLVAKTGQAGGLAWAVHLSDGKPAAGVKIAVRDRTNKVRFSGVTGADGTVALPAASALSERRPAQLRGDEPFEMENGEETIYLLAREGQDVAVLSGSWREGLYAWNFSVESRAPAGRARGFIQTDRGLYRPGEVVHLRGLARALRLGEGLVLPKDKQIAVLIEDPRGDEVLKKTVPLTAFGGFSIDLNLPGEARLGDWAVTATIGKGADAETFRDRFSVEEYRPATFEVALKPQKKTYLLGDKVRVDLRASYLYGAPLGKGRVTFSVRRRDHFPRFPKYEEFTFTDINAMEDLGYYWARYGERSYSYDATDQEAELDKQGRATLRFATADPGKEHKTAQDYLVEASVTDESSQSRTAQVAIIAHRSPFYLGLHATEYVPEAGKPFTVEAVALDDEGRGRAAEAELLVSLREWKCDYSQGAGGYYGSYRCQDKTTELERRKVQLSANGPSALPVTVKRAGTILLSLRAPSGAKGGGEVAASDQVWAVGRGEAFWRMNEGVKVPLQASKKRYRPGETALLVAQAPLSGATALVTIEREGVLSHRVQPFASSGEPFAVPLTDKHAPNVYVSVVLCRGRTGDGDQGRPSFGMGLVDLEVDPGEKRLRVEVSSDRPSYRPGETVKARVVVKTAAGAPVAAEVALAVADEGVLQLIGYKTPDPQAAFYAPFGLGVTTATSWNRLARRGDPNEDVTEGGDSGASAGKVRDKFVSTAFWAPALVTGADGSAEVSFQAPDNLTAFRLMAVAADAGDRFGNGEGRLTVAKPLQAMPALPRFLTVGDRVQAGVVVHNRTGAAGAVTVTASAEGAILGGGGAADKDRRREVQVPAGGEKLVLFDLKAPARGGPAKLTFTAALGAESDAVAVTIPIGRPLEQDALLLGEGEARPGEGVTLPVSLPKDAAEGELEVVLDPVGLSGVDEGLRYLIDYPYGCLEQTTSRVIPMVKVEDLARSLELPGLRGPKLRGFVESGVAKVLRHQHEDGAFSLWPGSGTEPFLTAYALFGLGQVKRAGYAVPEKSLSRGLDALKQGLSDRRGMGTSDNPLGEGGSRAFALYVLAEAGQPDGGAMEKLAADRKALPLFGQALLARALKRSGGDKELIAQIEKDVLAAVQPVAGVPGAARAVDPQQERLYWYYSSDVRTSALVLSMLLEIEPGHELVPQLVKGLLAARRGGHWDNTQDNLFSLIALADYARGKARRAQKGGAVKVALGGKVLLDAQPGGKPGGKAAGATGATIRRLQVPLAELKEGAALSIAATGEPMSYVARVRYGRSLERAAAAASGFQLERQLLDDKGKPKEALRAGDLVRVVLTVRADERRSRIALVDHLPAGLEPINPRLAVREAEGDDASSANGSDDRWDAMEMRDDRVAVFADELDKGRERKLSYLARVTSAGAFLWPAATVEEMYRPERRARTAAAVLEVRPR